MSEQETNVAWTALEINQLRKGMLKHALHTAGSGRWSHSRSAEEARQWMASDDRTQPFGFHACCIATGVKPGALREAFGVRKGHRLS